MTESRYQVRETRTGGDFEWKVIDTSRPLMFGGEHYKSRTMVGLFPDAVMVEEYAFHTLCECLERADADEICAALNGRTAR